MNRDDVLRMAKECGWIFDPHDKQDGFVWQLERFAALVAAAEAEELAQLMDHIAEGFERDSRRIASVTVHGCAAAIRARAWDLKKDAL